MPRLRRSAYRLVDPQICRGDERALGQHQRQPGPFRERHMSFLQQALECAMWSAVAHTQPLAAAPPGNGKPLGQSIEVDRSMARRQELEDAAVG